MLIMGNKDLEGGGGGGGGGLRRGGEEGLGRTEVLREGRRGKEREDGEGREDSL